ncbi:dihydroxyacetone kinase phosphoryl donor subunit DhaM [Amnibacterium kyonggiense]|uniref:Phosphocarrier protein HPr n=1 Tax=Amnibacterium kyonggiense TaxID=595671 RepID=A0A4R7FL11_9MICO|nr:dihydroxyacetone kinase phosphoryl donor subunit DhaM [Amnibacterium kyonggiense]TDS77056.1 phosphocarrier protein HPr /dihydroxyacetone kinase DhaM subunit [Amnibacterium kyonggiense]
MPVGLVFVSHSARIADGVVELAEQMASSVPLVAAGGTDDGGIGTSYDKVLAAIGAASRGQGVLIIGDLGSALMTAETAVDLLEAPPDGGVRVLDVPIVEGGVAAAVAAEAGEDLDAVARAATGEPAPDQPAAPGPAAPPAAAEADVELMDPEGLHARPAAALVKTVTGFDARVTVNGADASSLLRIIALGLRHGERVRVRAEGDQAAAAVDAVVALLGARPS